MAGSLGSIYVDLIARTVKYEDGFKRASRVTSDFERGVKSLLGQLAPLLGGAGLGAIAGSALKAADGVAKMADRLGLTTTAVQEYQHAIKLSGLESEQFEKAITKLNNNIAQGKLPFKDTESALAGIADKVAKARDGIERARVVTEAFGDKLGSKMIPFLKQGSEGIQQLRDEAEKLGLVIGDETIRSAEKFQDEIETLGNVIKTNFQAGLLEGFVDTSDEIRDIYTDPAFIQGVKDIGAAFGEVTRFVVEAVKAYQDAKVALAALGIEIASKFDKNSPFAIDKDVAEQALLIAGERLQKAPAAPERPKITQTGAGESYQDLLDRAKTLGDINEKLTREAVLVQTQVTFYGEKKDIIDRAVRAKEIELDLAERGIVLSAKEREAIQLKLDLLAENERRLNDLKEADEELKKQQRELTEIIGHAFEDAVAGGKDFREVLAGIEQDIKRIVLRTLVTKPFENWFSGILGGGSGGGGGGGGFFDGLGSLFSWLPKFDTGIDRVPNDMMAVIHKDEAVLKPSEAAAWRAGSGGQTINMAVYTPDANSFRASDRQIARQLKNRLAIA